MSTKETNTENDAIVFLADIQAKMKTKDRSNIIVCALCAVLCLGFVVISYSRVEAASNNVFVVDEGSALMAHRLENQEQKDLEVIDHVQRFHELLYNLAPNVNLINQSHARAAEMADGSLYDYIADQKENKYYARLIDINATQEIVTDSINVNVLKYPYDVETFATLYVLRESNISSYRIRTTCEVYESTRSIKNPHGLQIRKFYATKPQFIGTQKR